MYNFYEGVRRSDTNEKFSSFYNFRVSAEMPKDTNSLDLSNIEGNTTLGLNFMKQGLDNTIPDEYVSFKEKYGVGLINDGCATSPLSISKAVKNNKEVAAYLN